MWTEYPIGISIAGQWPVEEEGSLPCENVDIEAEGIAAQDCYPIQADDKIYTSLVIVSC